MGKSSKGSDYSRMRARRERNTRRFYRKFGEDHKRQNFRSHVSGLADATSDSGTGGSGIKFDPTILVYLIILFGFGLVMIWAAHEPADSFLEDIVYQIVEFLD